MTKQELKLNPRLNFNDLDLTRYGFKLIEYRDQVLKSWSYIICNDDCCSRIDIYNDSDICVLNEIGDDAGDFLDDELLCKLYDLIHDDIIVKK